MPRPEAAAGLIASPFGKRWLSASDASREVRLSSSAQNRDGIAEAPWALDCLSWLYMNQNLPPKFDIHYTMLFEIQDPSQRCGFWHVLRMTDRLPTFSSHPPCPSIDWTYSSHGRQESSHQHLQRFHTVVVIQLDHREIREGPRYQAEVPPLQGRRPAGNEKDDPRAGLPGPTTLEALALAATREKQASDALHIDAVADPEYHPGGGSFSSSGTVCCRIDHAVQSAAEEK